MKKSVLRLCILFVAVFCVLGCNKEALSETSLIEAAKNQDYKTFKRLVKNGASLSEMSESGMNVQLALAYFNDKDFKKVCSLLAEYDFDFDIPVENNVSLLYVLAYSCSYEKISTLLKYNVDVNRENTVTNLKPIDATQFSTFKFYSEQKTNPKNRKKAEAVRNLLLKHGSKEFNYSDLTMGNFGNVFFCFYNIIASYYPFITPQMVNYDNLFEFIEEDGQSMAVVKQDVMEDMFNKLSMKIEINNYVDSDEILNKLVEIEKSEDDYYAIVATGNNPIAPFQWVIISGVELDENMKLKKNFDSDNPDSLYQFVDFQTTDITHLITIKIN